MDETVASRVPIDSPEIRLDRLYRDLGESNMAGLPRGYDK